MGGGHDVGGGGAPPTAGGARTGPQQLSVLQAPLPLALSPSLSLSPPLSLSLSLSPSLCPGGQGGTSWAVVAQTRLRSCVTLIISPLSMMYTYMKCHDRCCIRICRTTLDAVYAYVAQPRSALLETLGGWSRRGRWWRTRGCGAGSGRSMSARSAHCSRTRSTCRISTVT